MARWRYLSSVRNVVVRGAGDVDDELAQSLQLRTLESLDFGYVIGKLRGHCYTAAALAMTQDPSALLASSPEEVQELYAAVTEVATLEDADLTLDDPLNVQAAIDACSRGSVLDPPQLREVSLAIEALLKLRNGLERAVARGAQLPTLIGIVEQIELPDELLDGMLGAFDEEGELSEAKFPELANMRQRIRLLEEKCASKIESVLSSGKYASYLADDGYMQIGGHYVLSVRPQHIRKVGQVMDQSRSGQTSYVEPREVVGMSAELIELQKELKFSVRRILGQMCIAVARASPALKACLQAAGEIDLARARLFLGEDMEGEVPEVRNEGVIMARHARNPCLLLRGGTRVVGNRVELGSWAQGIILSGPNAGGKTVVLKTIGLLALLVRCGIPVPAGESPRVDFFNVVLAEIGDMQTIVDDLSTYSAHLVASRIILASTEHSGARALVMIDEAGTGTDPMQGAALARAVLEALLNRGARVVATTHCMQLKNWALDDPRTEIAAMEYKQGRPTFKLVRNSVGESYAIETARRLELPASLVQRAEELLSEDHRSLLTLQRNAEELEKQLTFQVQKATEREAQAAVAERLAKERERAFAEKEKALADMERDLLARQERLRSQLEAEHRARVTSHERKLQEIMVILKQETGEGKGRLKVVGDAIEEFQLVRDEAAYHAEQRARLVPHALNQADSVSPGDWVVVLARTPWYGFKGRVQQVLGGAGGTPVRVKLKLEGFGDTLDLEKTELGKTSAPSRQTGLSKQDKKSPARDYSKMVHNW